MKCQSLGKPVWSWQKRGRKTTERISHVCCDDII